MGLNSIYITLFYLKKGQEFEKNFGGVSMNEKEMKVYLAYETECNLIKRTNKLDTIEEAVRLFIDTVNSVDDCIFVNIPQAKKRIAEL